MESTATVRQKTLAHSGLAMREGLRAYGGNLYGTACR